MNALLLVWLVVALVVPAAGNVGVAKKVGLVANAIEMEAQLRAEVEATYGIPELFADGMDVTEFGVALLEDRLLGAVIRQRPFVTAYTGTSLTAGHLLPEGISVGYPAVADALISPVMEKAGSVWESRNAAIGFNPPEPYSGCLASHAGRDVDLLTWEFSIVSASGAGPTKSLNSRVCNSAIPPAVEPYLRHALSVKDGEKEPLILFLDVDTWYQSERCDRLPYLGMMTGFCPEERRRNDTSPPVDLMKRYKNAGLALDNLGLLEKYVCPLPSSRREDPLFVTGSNPHPNAVGYALYGSMIGLHVLQVLVSALMRLEVAAVAVVEAQRAGGDASLTLPLTVDDLRGNTALQDLLLTELGLSLLDATELRTEGDLGSPSVCHKLSGGPRHFCDNLRSDCFTMVQPLHGGARFDLRRYIVDLESTTLLAQERGPDDDLIRPRTAVTEADYVYGRPIDDKWAVLMAEKKSNEPKIRWGENDPIDHKWALMGDASAGPIRFAFEVTQDHTHSSDRIHICSQTGDGFAMTDFRNVAEVRVLLDGVEVVPSQSTGWVPCVLLDVSTEKGRHELEIRPLVVGKYTVVTHIIFPQ